ncbi:SpoIIE family protein phosphatase [Ruminiclostridium cellulolyticum]|uniref:Protein serine/threonine phosphatase n=1 Tax=Ruminiclostridium cellulolyticum (strain ATCC 35319 / DSM 5812 / JCM 6584 / H10) TaxID=394503 RepID=B8I4Y2_RUMCH|nr:SpoIIE family protein phosphatase [Ruminiclostridium cellulolyticum]ACL76636.1 protein serine/threonine phosphatase [Ruminiclostridium cellulolyticum H10]
MSLYIDVSYESINKYNEELCGDKVEIIRSPDSVVVVLADGLGSGVKANILATLTSKIIGTIMSNGLDIEEAVNTVAKTLPVCKERGVAYSTFSIIQIFNNGEGYLAEFDSPSVIRLRKGKVMNLETESRVVNDKLIKEARFKVSPDDLFVMISDGVIHAGIGQTLNLGWQWDNVCEYIQKTYKKDASSKTLAKLLLSACDNLYVHEPGDDTTVVTLKAKKPVKLNLMIGPPVDSSRDEEIVSRFIENEGKKVVCGGTTSHIVARVLGKEIKTSIEYFNPAVPPTAEIEGINLTTEGVLTLRKTLDLLKTCVSPESSMGDMLKLNKKDGASRLAKMLLEESTSIYFFVGRAMNPAHQNPEFPLNMGMKFKLVEELAELLTHTGKHISIEYC